MAERAAGLTVTVVCSPAPRQLRQWQLQMAPGSTVLDALVACAEPGLLPGSGGGSVAVAVWGRKARPGQLLRENDRVEVLRPLTVDPKMARRERFRRQGARAAGLFARAGAGRAPD